MRNSNFGDFKNGASLFVAIIMVCWAIYAFIVAIGIALGILFIIGVAISKLGKERILAIVVLAVVTLLGIGAFMLPSKIISALDSDPFSTYFLIYSFYVLMGIIFTGCVLHENDKEKNTITVVPRNEFDDEGNYRDWRG